VSLRISDIININLGIAVIQYAVININLGIAVIQFRISDAM